MNSDNDAEREEKKLNEFAILPNKSDSDTTLARKAIDTTFVLTNHYDGQQQTVIGIEEMRKEFLNSLVSAISLSKENKIFFPIVPEDYHLGVAGAARVSSEIRNPQVLLSDPAFQKKAANTEVILFNGFTFTTKKYEVLTLPRDLLLQQSLYLSNLKTALIAITKIISKHLFNLLTLKVLTFKLIDLISADFQE